MYSEFYDVITNDVVLNILKDIRCFNTRGEFVKFAFRLNSSGSKLINCKSFYSQFEEK